MRLFILFILVASFVFADDVHYKNGCILTNVTTSKSGGIIIATYPNGKVLKIQARLIDKVVHKPVDINVHSKVVNCKKGYLNAYYDQPPTLSNSQSHTRVVVHYDKLALSIAAGVMAYDYFDTPKQFKTDKITARGILWGSVSVLSLFYSIDFIDIQVTPKSVSLSVDF